MKKEILKPATAKELGEFLGVSPRTCEQYPKNKLLLLKYGLAYIKNTEELIPVFMSVKGGSAFKMQKEKIKPDIEN